MASGVYEGSVLFRFCSANGLKQRVKCPTRDDNLLDFVISDIDPHRVDILPRISDHNMVLAVFDIGVPESVCVKRTVFEYSKAKWSEIQAEFDAFDWTPMDFVDVDAAERYFHDNVVAILGRHIPRRVISERKSSHPWINDRCLEAIAVKNASLGAVDFASKAVSCSAILFGKFLSYVARMRDKLLREKRGSKRWWKIANEIMDVSAQFSSIPTLKTESGWVYDQFSNANLLADVFS